MTRSAKSSQIEKIRGSQEPSERIAPKYKESDGEDAVKILSAGGIKLDPWQEDILNDWLGRNEVGKWASPTCGGSVPRQNGKSFLIQGRAEAGMLMFNEQVIYTAHLQKTATETFEEMRDFFEGSRLKKYVSEIKTALGREQIILKTGARIKFLARTRNGGRGQHGDLLIIDEAQEMDETQQASFLPAISASLNPQTVYVGTPPDPNSAGSVFRNIRQRALAGKTKNTAWFEFSVKEIGDVKDKVRWANSNPALGKRILLSTIEGECEQMDEDTFARERLGWWSLKNDRKGDPAIDKEAWKACRSSEPKPSGKTALGVKISVDGSSVALAGAVLTEEGKGRITLIEYKSTSGGFRWLSDWLNKRYMKVNAVAIDGKNGTQTLIDQIKPTWKSPASVMVPNAKDVIAAASLLIDMVNEKTLTWYELQDDLNESAVSCIKRPISGGFGFGGENSLPIEACALALWACKTTKRDVNRKMRIG